MNEELHLIGQYKLSNIFDFKKINDEEYLKDCGLKMNKYKDYKIIKYNKEILDCYKNGLIRSLVFKNNKLVSFSPVKSIPLDDFEKKAFHKDKIVYEEFVEGTMINAFYTGDEWEIATRSLVGARGKFFKDQELTFRTMFLECMNECGLEFEHLNKHLVYSFVISHPKNRIVAKVREPQLYLCEVYQIINKENEIIVNQYSLDDFNYLEQYVYFPNIFTDVNSIKNAKEMYGNSIDTPYQIMGVVLKYQQDDHTLIRSKIRNPNYEKVKQLRGNQPKIQFQYINLRKCGKVRDFLTFYPEFKNQFTTFRQQIHDYTNNLFNYYILCYIKKFKSLNKFPLEYRTHMYNLHQNYIKNLMPQQKYTSREEVIKYVNSLEPELLMYCLNYKLREQKIKENSEKNELTDSV